VIVREAKPDDLPALRELFNALIPTATIAWREKPASSAEMERWFAEQQRADHPVLVAELDGRVVGYTSWSTFRGGPRFPGYRHTVEDTIHVDVAHHRRGIGRTLLGALIDEARRREVHVIVAGLDSANHASIQLHRAMGFAEVARMPEVGRKFDRWLDLVLMQRIVT
jgi:L-amino acid N-acyltransferase YncA